MRRGFKGKGSPRKRTAPHNIADDFERDKHQKELVKFQKQLNEDGTPKKPLTESQIMGLLRGAIREKWMYAPNKLAFLNMHIIPDDDPETRRRWKVQCHHCKEWFKKGEVQVDHKVGENSLKNPDDLYAFYNSIMNIGYDDMQLLCEPCHDIKSAMERYGYSEEEAKIFKRVTALEAALKNEKARKEFLVKRGLEEKAVSNKDKRRTAFWQFIVENPNFRI